MGVRKQEPVLNSGGICPPRLGQVFLVRVVLNLGVQKRERPASFDYER